MKAIGLYAAACVISVALLGAIGWSFTSPAGQRLVLISAALAVGVQLAGFAVVRLLAEKHLLLGWGIGSGIRVVALVLYALVVARLWQAPLAPALLSFAAFLFVTTVVEPVFLKR